MLKAANENIKTKLFTRIYNYSKVEDDWEELNDFIQKREIIDIKYQLTFDGNHIIHSALVIYRI